MSPLLFPLLLLLYGECSEDKVTRFTSRVFLYGYSFSLLLLSILPPNDVTIILASLPYFISYGYLFFTSKINCVRVITVILITLQGVNYFSLYFESYYLLTLLPFYFEYSNVILREITVICIGSCTSTFKVDFRLKIFTGILYLIEYSYITRV